MGLGIAKKTAGHGNPDESDDQSGCQCVIQLCSNRAFFPIRRDSIASGGRSNDRRRSMLQKLYQKAMAICNYLQYFLIRGRDAAANFYKEDLI